MNYIIVGNSAAGLFAVEELRRRDPHAAVTVLTAEREPSYSRCLTTYFLAGDIPAARLYLRGTDFAEKLKLNIVYGVRVTALDAERGVVKSEDGREWAFDKLLLAMGASAVKPDIPGREFPEVFTLRTMEDALAINSVLKKGAQKAVVIGGGLVSLKSAYALRKRGLEVTVVVSSGQILSQMLDPVAAGLIQQHLEMHGMRFLLRTEALAVTGEGHVQGVSVSGGNEVAANLVIVGKGVSPNTANLRNSGLEIGRGIRVDASMATNFTHIYAAGDIAETWDRVRGAFAVNATWPNATAQGWIAGANMSGGHEVYPGSLGLNSVDFFGFPAMSAGITKILVRNGQNGSTNEPGNWHREESFKMAGRVPVYRNLIWQGDVLKGFVLVGDTSQAGVLTALVKSGHSLTKSQKDLTMRKRGALVVPLLK